MLCRTNNLHSAALLPTLLLALLASPTMALTINVIDGSQNVPGCDCPSSTHPDDPTNSLLLAIAEQAAADWSAVLEDNWTMNLVVHYATEEDTGTTTATTFREKIDTQKLGSGNNQYERVEWATIRVYEDINAYFDPTPEDDVEFSQFSQTLLGDLSPDNGGNYIDQGYDVTSGDPWSLEIGARWSGNPAAVGKHDLLTVMRHEIGHYMGFNLFSDNEGDDDDLDIPPSLLGGAQVGVMGRIVLQCDVDNVPCDSNSPPALDNNGNIVRTLGHMQDQRLLMSPVPEGTRNEITAADIMSAAAGNGWTSINLQRVDYIGPTGQFATAANWTDGRKPASTDLVAIRNGVTVALTSNETVSRLEVSNDSTLFLTGSAALLFVDGEAILGDSTATPSSDSVLLLNPGTTFIARDLTINDGSVTLVNATLRSSFDIHNKSTIVSTASGSHVLVNGTLWNNGTIRASNNQMLTIGGALIANPTADLDGMPAAPGNPPRHGTIDALAGSLQVLISNAEEFSGTMNIGAGQFVDLKDDWTLLNGALNFSGQAASPGVLRGGDLVVRGTVNAAGHGKFGVEVHARSGQINVPNASDTITFEQAVTFEGGSHTGAGKHTYEGPVVVEVGTVNIGHAEFVDGAPLTINGGSYTAETINAGKSAIQLNDGSLRFELLEGKLTNLAGDLQFDKATLNGTYTQEEDGVLKVAVNGNDEEFVSKLTVNGTVTLAGSINPQLPFGFTPAANENFIILESTERIEVTDQLQLTGFYTQFFELFVEDNLVGLTALPQPIAGDYNDDGAVDMADYSAWRDNLGAAAGALPNDTDGGAIGMAQYNTWKSNFGTQSAAANVAGQPVPEPRTAILLAGALAVLVAARHSQQCPHAGSKCQ